MHISLYISISDFCPPFWWEMSFLWCVSGHLAVLRDCWRYYELPVNWIHENTGTRGKTGLGVGTQMMLNFTNFQRINSNFVLGISMFIRYWAVIWGGDLSYVCRRLVRQRYWWDMFWKRQSTHNNSCLVERQLNFDHHEESSVWSPSSFTDDVVDKGWWEFWEFPKDHRLPNLEADGPFRANTICQETLQPEAWHSLQNTGCRKKVGYRNWRRCKDSLGIWTEGREGTHESSWKSNTVSLIMTSATVFPFKVGLLVQWK